MAVTHIKFNAQSDGGRFIRRAVDTVSQGQQWLKECVAGLASMLDGDGTNVAHFTYMTAQCGFPDNATAKAAWDELNSINAKLTTDGSVSAVNAAILQAKAKFL
jgi:hypothetical protein